MYIRIGIIWEAFISFSQLEIAYRPDRRGRGMFHSNVYNEP
jgi:hypothetical protein